MKITLYIPKGKTDTRNFLNEEIAEAMNIKSKSTRKTVIAGLRKMLNAINPYEDGGIAMFTDGEDLIIEKYDGVKKLYHCGHEYKRIEVKTGEDILLCVIDSKDAAIGKTDGENITVLWEDQSLVPNKHGMGGQSAARFGRARQEELKQWMRKVGEHLQQEFHGQPIKIGGCGMVKEAFIKELPL